jgi:hypothetical protein
MEKKILKKKNFCEKNMIYKYYGKKDKNYFH